MRASQRYAYRPDLFESVDGTPVIGAKDESRAARRKRAARQVALTRHGEDPRHCTRRVKRLLAETFRRDPFQLFRPNDLDSFAYKTRDRWYADANQVRARVLNVQFKIYNRANGGARARDPYQKQLARCKAPDEKTIVNAKQKYLSYYFEDVRDPERRLRQLGGRQHDKTKTHIDCVMEVYNADPSKPLSAAQLARLDDAKSRRARAGDGKRRRAGGNASDRQLLGIVSMVVRSILAGEQQFMLIVYDLLLGDVGKICAPKTRKFMLNMHERIESQYLQIKNAE